MNYVSLLVIYGTNRDATHAYEQMVCRYFFGSYSFVELPEGIEAVDRLLQRCPLKVLTNIAKAEGPRPDCAPAAVNCRPFKNRPLQHPFDKISCERNIRARQ